MLHIVKSKKKGYLVVAIASNSQVLSTSEVLSSKQKCWQNIRALLKDCFVSLADHLYPGLVVQDDTGEKPTVWFVSKNKKDRYSVQEPEKRYVVK